MARSFLTNVVVAFLWDDKKIVYVIYC